MPEDLKYTDFDLKVSEELGGIKTLQQTILDKLDGYCKENERQHNMMWRRVDEHGRSLSRIYGGAAVVSAAIGGLWMWLRER